MMYVSVGKSLKQKCFTPHAFVITSIRLKRRNISTKYWNVCEDLCGHQGCDSPFVSKSFFACFYLHIFQLQTFSPVCSSHAHNTQVQN